MATQSSILTWRIPWTEESGWATVPRVAESDTTKVTQNAHILGSMSSMVGSLVAKPCWILATLWTVPHQAPPPMGFPRGEYWTGLPFPFLGDLPNPGIQPRSPTLQVVSCIASLIPGSGRSPGGGHNNLFLYFCHGQRNLAGYSPQGRKESDMTE